MSRIVWNAVGERLFEVGVDRGVLFVDDMPGVPWNGLVSVDEKPSKGGVSSYHIDGIKYLDHAPTDEFAAEIEAYTYPDEFAVCEGTVPVTNGLFVTQQAKKTFGLAYRTRVGNDVEGLKHGYKIHLVYNAIAQSSDHDNQTIADAVDPFNFSWSITTKPPTFIGYKPTSHFVIDSRDVPTGLLEKIEDVIYGTTHIDPRLPSVPELMFIFEEYNPTSYDAGTLVEEYFLTIDAGVIPEPQTDTVYGGGP